MLARDHQAVSQVDPTDEVEDEVTLAEYEAEGGISHEAVMAWVRSWGTRDELPPPQTGDYTGGR